jgi:hypothetical protein
VLCAFKRWNGRSIVSNRSGSANDLYKGNEPAPLTIVKFVRLIFLITEDLLAPLAAGHAVLLLLSQLRRGELLLLLGAFNLVAQGVELLFLVVLLGETRSCALALDPVMAYLDCQLTFR